MVSYCLPENEAGGYSFVRIPRVYLETTLFNFIFADDAPEKRQDTIKLFDEIRQGAYEPYTSFAVLDELKKTAGVEKREKMLALINEYDVGIIQDDAEADLLTDLYINEGIIPLKYRDDALHIAVASIAEMHIILSWNFQHIVKLKTRYMVNVINIREGYRTFDICSPKEVIENDTE
jgi:predicted nucleic acid-binding protein